MSFLCRSWMFVPGNNSRRLAKASELPADIVIYDLEDAVPLDEKEMARSMVHDAILQSRNQANFVRVNDSSTPFFRDDLEAITGKGLSGIILPKASGKKQLEEADRLLTSLEHKNGLPEGSIQIVPLIESALGLHHSFEIASSCKRVKRLAFGSVDFTLDIGAQLTKEGTELLYARSRLVVCSKAAGIDPPIDAVYTDIRDRDGLYRDTHLAKQLGFQGKLVIHPDQIDVVNEVFNPTKEEIREAHEIVEAFDQALSIGSASIQREGKMIDYPVYERAKRIVRKAEALQEIEGIKGVQPRGQNT